MQNLMNVQDLTMSSLDFLNNIINPSREAAGESPVRPSDFHARVVDEIGEELNYENFVVGKTGHKTYYAMLNMEQMTLVGMRESKAVRRAVLEKLKELSHRPQMTQAELIAAMAELNVAQERRLKSIEVQVEQVVEEIDHIKQGTLPAGYQGYSYLQATYGLSNAKSRQLVMAWNVSSKKVPHRTPHGQFIQMSVVHEEDFLSALHHMMNEAEPRGTQWHHPKMGRFAIAGWEVEGNKAKHPEYNGSVKPFAH